MRNKTRRTGGQVSKTAKGEKCSAKRNKGAGGLEVLGDINGGGEKHFSPALSVKSRYTLPFTSKMLLCAILLPLLLFVYYWKCSMQDMTAKVAGNTYALALLAICFFHEIS